MLCLKIYKNLPVLFFSVLFLDQPQSLASISCITDIFSSPGPKGPCELLPSLGVRRRPSYLVIFFKDLL